MLDAKDWAGLFTAARQAGYEEIEVYTEGTASVRVQFAGRTDDICFSFRRGMSVRAKRGGVAHHFFSDATDTQALIAQLRGETYRPTALPSEPATGKVPADLTEGASAILQTIRTAFSSQSEGLQFPQVSATLSRRHYQVARDPASPSGGWEESADCRAEWNYEGTAYAWERARGSIAGLVADLASPEGLAPAVKLSFSTATRWPAPQGRVPVLWSARSVAKLQMLLLRAFEGDLVLGNRSFLTSLEGPLPVLFTLEDRPCTEGGQVDHEGSARRTTWLLREGKPTALACSKQIAEQLEVTPTGHARRQSFESPAVVGFWHAHLEGADSRDGLLAGMDHGISVRDIDILSFDPASGRVALRLTRAYLVHHGAEGEPMESVTLKLPLLTLLESLSQFERQPQTTGLAVGKQNQRLYTEITAPAALSKPLPVPGSVPLNHYW